MHLANSYVDDHGLTNVGHLSVLEAQNALRRQRGNVWKSVVDAVEKRQEAVRVDLSSQFPTDASNIPQQDLE